MKESTTVVNKCRVCGTEYGYCYSCDRQNSWRGLADTIDHYYLLLVLMTYNTDHDAKKAYDALSSRGFDFSDTKMYTTSVQTKLAKIYAEVNGDTSQPSSEKKASSKSTPKDAPEQSESDEETLSEVL